MNPFRPTQTRSEWVRLRTLVNLRWLAIIGQTLALIVATQFLDIDLRLDLCALLVALSAAFNIGLMLVNPENKRLKDRDAMLSLLFDLTHLSALLFLTGGLNNPFAVLLLPPTMISATVLTLNATLVIGAVTIAAITILGRFHISLATRAGDLLEMPDVLVLGIWVSLFTTVVFLGGYARRVTEETYSMSEALTATQLALEQEQKLTTLGGVVAAAAHELGTPLATIKLVSAELVAELSDRPDLREDVELIRSQTDRCRDILRNMGKSGKDDLLLRHAPLMAVVAEAAEPHMHRGKRVILRADALSDAVGPDVQPEIPRHAEIIHGLRNLVQNAVDFAESTVWIDLDWNDTEIRVTVGDDGKGYPPDLMGRIGDPFVRRRSAQMREEVEARPGYEGMGLGLFIAKTLLERSGAKLTFANGAEFPEAAKGGATPAELARPTGAIVELIWQRGALDVGRAKTRGPLGLNTPVVG